MPTWGSPRRQLPTGRAAGGSLDAPCEAQGLTQLPLIPWVSQELKLLSASQAPAIKSLLCRSCLVYGWVFGFLGAEAASLSSVSSLWSMFCALSLDALGFCISSSSLGTF